MLPPFFFSRKSIRLHPKLASASYAPRQGRKYTAVQCPTKRAASAIAARCIATCTALPFPSHNRSTRTGAPTTAKKQKTTPTEEKGCAQSPTRTPNSKKAHPDGQATCCPIPRRPHSSTQTLYLLFGFASTHTPHAAQFLIQDSTILIETKPNS